jgi:CheY-like chemotaxis protein
MAMPASFQSAKLLVVDGVAENRRLLVRRLQRHGRADVATPSDGMEALDALPTARVEARPFAVVLLDVNAAHERHGDTEDSTAETSLSTIPVMMVSTATEVDTVVRCIKPGAEDDLARPFDPVLLRTRLGLVSEKKRLRDEAWRQQFTMLPDDLPQPDPVSLLEVHALMRSCEAPDGRHCTR